MIGIVGITQRLIEDLKKQGFKGDVTVTFNPDLKNYSSSWTIEVLPEGFEKSRAEQK